MIEIKLYDKIKLKTGEIARIVDILKNETTTGYIVDIEEDDDYRTETIFIDDIKSIFIEKEIPLKSAV
ncbi:MAG: hypothetical protein FWD23_12090 [Oscillospiraceae bacterium]|nr:hypothetical protein [Oscillospiraceae bacterium]